MIIDGSSIYDIIMMAYTKAAGRTGKKIYMPYGMQEINGKGKRNDC